MLAPAGWKLRLPRASPLSSVRTMQGRPPLSMPSDLHLARQIRIGSAFRSDAGASRMEITFTKGLTALVGANDAGKTAVIDALRFALGTSDQDRQRLPI